MRMRPSYFAVALLTFVIGISANSLWLEFHSIPEPPKPSIKNNDYPVRQPISQANEEPEPKFNPTGYYYFAGRSWKGFEEIEWIDIDTAEIKSDSYRWVATPPSGFIRASGKIYKMSHILINEKTISFSTESINGKSYNFSGRFLRDGVYYEILNESSVVLEGRLTKLIDGQKIVEKNVGLTWFGGD